MRLGLLAVLIAIAGCEAQPCVRHSDCPSGLTCQAGTCAAPPTDGAVDGSDGGPLDAGGRDAPMLDVGSDAAAIDTAVPSDVPDDASVDGSIEDAAEGDASDASLAPDASSDASVPGDA